MSKTSYELLIKQNKAEIAVNQKILGELENLEKALSSDFAKTLLKSFDTELDSIRMGYAQIDPKHENSLIDLAKLQGQEHQVVTHKSMFVNIGVRKKELVNQIQNLINFNNENRDTEPKSGSLVSQNIRE